MFTNHILWNIPPLDVDAVNIHQAARFFSLFLVEAAKTSIPLAVLVVPQSLVVPGSGICSAGVAEGPLQGTPVLG